jgi:hypothetical protein
MGIINSAFLTISLEDHLFGAGVKFVLVTRVNVLMLFKHF